MKVLIICSDTAILAAIADEFKNKNLVVYKAKNIGEAKIVLLEEQLSIIVTDYALPDGHFFDCYDKLKEKQLDNPDIFILTDSQDKETAEISFIMGAVALFVNPFSIEILIETVENASFARLAGFSKRRTYERVDLFSEGKIIGKESTLEIEALLTNISFSGCFLAIHNNIPKKDDEIEYNLKLSKSHALQGKATVEWVREIAQDELLAGCGIKFTGERIHIVKALYPIINEFRTHQIDMTIAEKESLYELINHSIHIAQTKIGLNQIEFSISHADDHLLFLCRYIHMMYAFTSVFYELIRPLKNNLSAFCRVNIQDNSADKMNYKIEVTSTSNGVVFLLETLLEEKIKYILEAHKIKTHISSDESSLCVTLLLPVF